MPPSLTLDAALPRLGAQLALGRVILGVSGPPAAGKSTVAQHIVRWATAQGWPAVVVPMDGFHLAQSVLDEHGLADVKGAPETFDAVGYAELLGRVRTQRGDDPTIWAPHFDRSIENAIAGSIGVRPEHQLILTEGNYLTLGHDPWLSARSHLNECWYLDLPDTVRRARLIARHQDFGRSPQQAADHANGSDETNARLVASRRHYADLLVQVD